MGHAEYHFREKTMIQAIHVGEYIAGGKRTVREAAEAFRFGKTKVHNLVTKVLPCIDPTLASMVEEVLQKNKAERHIRGGMVTQITMLARKQGRV